MRVLVVIAPAMYRQTLTYVLTQCRPSIEIKSVAPSDVDREVDLFKPDLLISQDELSDVGYSVPSWVEILYSDSMGAHVRKNEKASRTVEEMMIEDMELEDLLAVVDETQERISRH
jgi:hypothetical protein